MFHFKAFKLAKRFLVLLSLLLVPAVYSFTAQVPFLQRALQVRSLDGLPVG